MTLSGPVRQRHWTLRRRIAEMAAAVAGVLALLLAAVVISAVRFAQAGNSVVNRWDPAVTSTQRLLTDVVDEETGLRGYALSSAPASLQPYRQARRVESADTTRLRNALGDDHALRTDLQQLLAATAQWQSTVAAPAISGIAAGQASAVRLVESPAAKARFDVIRAKAQALSTAVQLRAEQARHSRRTAGTAVAIAAGVTVLGLLLLAYGIWRGLHRWVLAPVDRLANQTRTVARGETYRQIVPDGPLELTGLGRDVEAMRLQIAGQLARAEQAQRELQDRTDELARSNEDLQQFAYVASHDLSEPLRKVANFCQLLERQYADQLDDRARQYIDFAVDGAKRMQVLITDLLALSRVGRTTEAFVPVDLEDALDGALRNLADKSTEAEAHVERLDPLPTVSGDRSLLVSLLENLVGNAIKYRREDMPPVVRISAELDAENRTWEFAVHDNGIGIDPQYADRIFAVFQRLHLRDRYGGTGIGLALCRKIVEFHGGRIWLDTVQSSGGAKFRFTLPEGGVLAQPRQ